MHEVGIVPTWIDVAVYRREIIFYFITTYWELNVCWW